MFWVLTVSFLCNIFNSQRSSLLLQSGYLSCFVVFPQCKLYPPTCCKSAAGNCWSKASFIHNHMFAKCNTDDKTRYWLKASAKRKQDHNINSLHGPHWGWCVWIIWLFCQDDNLPSHAQQNKALNILFAVQWKERTLLYVTNEKDECLAPTRIQSSEANFETDASPTCFSSYFMKCFAVPLCPPQTATACSPHLCLQRSATSKETKTFDCSLRADRHIWKS